LNDDLGLIFPEHCFRKHTWRLYKGVNKEYKVLPPITLFEYFIEHGNKFDVKICGECSFKYQCEEYQDKAELMRRMVYKDFGDMDSELIEKILKEKKEIVYKSMLRFLTKDEARASVNRIFWFLKNKPEEKQKERGVKR